MCTAKDPYCNLQIFWSELNKFNSGSGQLWLNFLTVSGINWWWKIPRFFPTSINILKIQGLFRVGNFFFISPNFFPIVWEPCNKQTLMDRWLKTGDLKVVFWDIMITDIYMNPWIYCICTYFHKNVPNNVSLLLWEAGCVQGISSTFSGSWVTGIDVNVCFPIVKCMSCTDDCNKQIFVMNIYKQNSSKNKQFNTA